MNAKDPGASLPLVESFYTIQGEGFHTGKPAYFVRIGGCDVGCSWCDTKFSWDPTLHPEVDVREIIRRIRQTPASSVVVTGGEPMMFNLDLFCNILKEDGFQLFLETSGAHPMTGTWDWICLSPKPGAPPLEAYLLSANELKVIIQTRADFSWAETCRERVHPDCLCFLQPEWSQFEKIIPDIVAYVKSHPGWMVSLQAHKFMHIP
jgi:organic radical activating enzyme